MANGNIIELDEIAVSAQFLNLLEVAAKTNSRSAWETSVILNKSTSYDLTIEVDPQKLKAKLSGGRLSISYGLEEGWDKEFSKSVPVNGWTTLTIRGTCTGEFLILTGEIKLGKNKIATIGAGGGVKIDMKALGDKLSVRVPGYKSAKDLKDFSNMNRVECIVNNGVDC